MRSRKSIFVKPGESNGFTLALPSGASKDVQEETDHEYISEQLRQGRQKKLAQERRMEDRRYFYGRPAPRLGPARLAALKSALAFFDRPVAAELEGSTAGARRKLFSHISCIFCYSTFRHVDKEQFLAHVSRHEEIQDYLQFADRARRDYESLQMRRDELDGQAKKLRTRLRGTIQIARRLRSEERALERMLAEQGQVDEAAMQMVAGGTGHLFGGSDDVVVVVKETEELRSIRKQALDAEDRERRESSQLERNLVERRAVDRQIERFEKSPDTSEFAATADDAEGKAGGDYDVVAQLLQEQEDYLDPVAAATSKKATYVAAPYHRFIPSEGGSRF